MPNSGTVTAGSVALASQYNNLRSDVLDASTGHTHTGAADAGAQIEGTALKSTGATAGHVLTAGTGGTATTWAAVQSDQGTFATATVSFSFAGANDFFTSYVGTAGSAQYVGGGGTIIALFQNFGGYVNSYQMKTFVVPAHTADSTATAFGSAMVSSVAGSADDIYMLDSNGAPSTAIYWFEYDYPSYANNINFLRKYKTDLTASIWNANLGTASDPDLPAGIYDGYRPFQYFSQIDAWIGATYNPYLAAGTAKVYVINDTSGSVYKADFGINTGSGVTWSINGLAYVPSTGTALGTAYVYGYIGSTKRLVTYSVGSASITALSTAANWDPLPSSVNVQGIQSVYFDSTISKLIVQAGTSSGSRPNYYGLDRTGGTLMWTSVSAGTVKTFGRYQDYSVGHGIGVFGTDGTGYAPQSLLLPVDGSTYMTNPFATGGTLLSFADGQYSGSGTVTTRSIARLRKADGTLGTASFGRIFWSSGTSGISVVATTVNDSYTMATGLNYLPAGGTYTRVATDATATGTVTDTLYTLRMK